MTQLCEYTFKKHTELYTLREWILWHVSYISMTLLFKSEWYITSSSQLACRVEENHAFLNTSWSNGDCSRSSGKKIRSGTRVCWRPAQEDDMGRVNKQQEQPFSPQAVLLDIRGLCKYLWEDLFCNYTLYISLLSSILVIIPEYS